MVYILRVPDIDDILSTGSVLQLLEVVLVSAFVLLSQ